MQDKNHSTGKYFVICIYFTIIAQDILSIIHVFPKNSCIEV